MISCTQPFHYFVALLFHRWICSVLVWFLRCQSNVIQTLRAVSGRNRGERRGSSQILLSPSSYRLDFTVQSTNTVWSLHVLHVFSVRIFYMLCSTRWSKEVRSSVVALIIGYSGLHISAQHAGKLSNCFWFWKIFKGKEGKIKETTTIEENIHGIRACHRMTLHLIRERKLATELAFLQGAQAQPVVYCSSAVW